MADIKIGGAAANTRHMHWQSPSSPNWSLNQRQNRSCSSSGLLTSDGGGPPAGTVFRSISEAIDFRVGGRSHSGWHYVYRDCQFN